MKAYFYIFVSVSLFTFLMVMQQIKSAVAETERESTAWISVQVPRRHGG